MRTLPARILLSLLFCAGFSQPLFAGGSDVGHSGGGGTFVKSKFSRQLVFWDLFEHNPQIQDNEAGDTIVLSAAGVEAKGEWVDYRHFKSYNFLQLRLDDWARRAPLFARVLRENDTRRDLLLIGTTLSIQKILEIDVPDQAKRYGGLAVPGAYFDYSNGRIFLDIKVWNKAGLQSQAAMLLHERLREVQLRFGLSNAFIQDIVYDVVMMEPEHVKQFDEWRFAPERAQDGTVPLAWPARQSRTDALPTAGDEVQEAVNSGILGSWQLFQPPKPSDVNPPCDRGTRPNGGSDVGHSGGQGCEPPRI